MANLIRLTYNLDIFLPSSLFLSLSLKFSVRVGRHGTLVGRWMSAANRMEPKLNPRVALRGTVLGRRAGQEATKVGIEVGARVGRYVSGTSADTRVGTTPR